MHTYIELSNYYASIGNLKAGIEGLCMDIVDWVSKKCSCNKIVAKMFFFLQMNSTQLFWSKKCCIYRRHDEFTFIFLTSVISCLPILFYLSARYFGIIRKTTIRSRKAEVPGGPKDLIDLFLFSSNFIDGIKKFHLYWLEWTVTNWNFFFVK